jgi:LytS/YehU family sensor histidine kinase
VLASRGRDLVPLAEELAFAHRYHRLLVLRFGDAITLWLDASLSDTRAAPAWRVPPLALQTLLENAVKHNQLGDDAPLTVRMTLAEGAIEAANAVMPRRSTRASTGLGLANLDERCRLLTGRGLDIDRSGGRFAVRVPLVPAA